jgi:hypothetical protein
MLQNMNSREFRAGIDALHYGKRLSGAVYQTHSAHNNSACASTVFTASSCKSGG